MAARGLRGRGRWFTWGGGAIDNLYSSYNDLYFNPTPFLMYDGGRTTRRHKHKLNVTLLSACVALSSSVSRD